MPQLEIALLGAPEIKLDGSAVKSDRRKAIALLAYLAVSDISHPRAHLAALLWPDYDQDSAYAYLRRTLWELNQMLGKGWIEADRERIGLISNRDFLLDVSAFQRLLNTHQNGVDELIAAVGLYRGDFLAGFSVADSAPFEDWQYEQTEYYRREFASALKALVASLHKSGEYEQALPYARRWLALDQLDESAHRAIMRLLADMGDRAGAVRQYETCARIVKTELDIEPQPETTELYEAILRGDFPGRQPVSGFKAKEKADQAEIEQPLIHLPVMPTTFIGRRTEVEQVKSLIIKQELRLVTLIGPGGTGKTRLSIQAASEVGEVFPDGVFFAPLASVSSTVTLIPAVAKAVGLSFFGDEHPRQQLLDYLHGKQLLLIMDNFEHLVDASELLGEILIHAPGVKLLVTSRVRLNMQVEQLYPVGGMSTPEAAEISGWEDHEEQAKPYSAVQLFMERARRVKPDFLLTKENALAVLEICQLVQGMPLGLELAAAWVELLVPGEIAAEIARSLDFLETDQPDVPRRQRSLRAVFESSWKLLSEAEQAAFLRLCVFLGSFTRQAAQQVSGASLQTLLGLANKSWLQHTDDGRFQLHELMRQYGEQHLISNESAWRNANERHAGFFSDFVHQQTQRMQSSEQVAGLKAMAEEFDTNIKKAWDWMVSERRWQELTEKMVMGLYQFGDIRWQNSDLISWFRSARLASASRRTDEEQLSFAIFSTLEVNSEEESQVLDADPIERLESIWQMVNKHGLAEVMGLWYVILASLVRIRNLASDMDEQIEANISRLRDQNKPWQLGVSLMYRANRLSEYAYNENCLLEAADIFEKLGVICEQAMVAEMLGKHAYDQRRPLSEATRYYNKAQKLFQALKGYSPRTGINLLRLADIYFRQGQYEQGFSLFEEEQREMERMGLMRSVEASLHWESLFAARYSTYEHALQMRERSLEMTRQYGSQSDLAWRLFELGEVHRIFGDSELAIGFYKQALPMFEQMNMTLALGFAQRAKGDIALREGRYPDALAHYQKYFECAREDNHLWGMVQSRARIALVNAYLGEPDQARPELRGALADVYAIGEDDLALDCLIVEAVCLVQEGKQEAAVELTAFLLHQPGAWNETKMHARKIYDSAANELTPDAMQSAVERGRALEFQSVVGEIAGSN